jgi:hypothetical protein
VWVVVQRFTKSHPASTFSLPASDNKPEKYPEARDDMTPMIRENRKFRFTRSELADIRESIRSGKMYSWSAAIERELIEAARLGEAYPFRKENRGDTS